MRKLRPLNRLTFFLERQFAKGTHYQLLVMAALVGLISLLGGLLVTLSSGAVDGVGDAVWWAFLRLTDPGYLGDDDGLWRRIVSTGLTVSGYVVFMGALIAILTQWLISRVRSLERGLTPVALKNHIVILGWTNRTLPILRELLLSEGRMRRFLATVNARRRQLRLVVLAEDLGPELAEELRNDAVIGPHFRKIILRSGSALNAEHLLRADCLNAAAVILPARTFDHDSQISSDVETVKALLSLDGLAQSSGAGHPYLVAEIQDPRKAAIARRAYHGTLEVVAGDASISRLMVQNVRHPGLSEVYVELLSHDIGNNIYVRRDPGMTGRTITEITFRLSNAVACGVVRTDASGRMHALLNPPGDFTIAPRDALVLVARSYETALATGSASPPPAVVAQQMTSAISDDADAKRILVLGWSRKVPALLREVATYGEDTFQVHVVSTRPVEERLQQLSNDGVLQPAAHIRHTEADFTVEQVLHELDLARYDSILLMSSDRLGSGEEADARSIMAYLLLEGMLAEQGLTPQLLLELSDPHNERLMGQRSGEVIISPLLLSHILAQVALRPELRIVYDALFSAGGPEITFRLPGDLDISDPDITFEALHVQARQYGETALGIERHGDDDAPGRRRLELNPERGMALALAPGDRIVTLMTNPASALASNGP